jgi:cell division protein FtsB
MNKHINLMSPRAQVRECTRVRLWQWSRILAASAGLLALHGAITWWPVHVRSLQRAALEAQYEPLRQMKMDNKALAREIAGTLDESKLELALSKQTPMATLVGLVGRAVAGTHDKVFLDKITFSEAETDGGTGAAPSRVSLEGIGVDPVAVSQFADLLESSLSFAKVKVGTVEAIEVNQHPMHTFQIEFSF